MADDFNFSTGLPSEEMADYLQMYLDETAEHLDALVEVLLRLENRPNDVEQLNEAFRLIHSIKGSAGLMGLDSITALTHRLENHFERLRSGLATLDKPMMDLILRCIDFLRHSNGKLRGGEPLNSAPDLLEELGRLQAGGGVMKASATQVSPASAPVRAAFGGIDYRVSVRFEAGLQLIDLKGELVLARLDELGEIHDTRPPRDRLEELGQSRLLQVLLSSELSPDQLRIELRIDGIEDIRIDSGTRAFRPVEQPEPEALGAEKEEPPLAPPVPKQALSPQHTPERSVWAVPVDPLPLLKEEGEESIAASSLSANEGDARSKVVETVRVEIDRLDALMNLAGELVVNRARFVQIARRMSPAFRKSSLAARTRNFGETMRRAIQQMRSHFAEQGDEESLRWLEHAHEYEAELDAIEEQSKWWDESRRGFGQITEAIDQLTRVSNSLQRGVLETRMVPVGPLFNRFKRVVRDIAHEREKKVRLEIHGEKTELDKRMIDELGDPLVHLIRNAIDHGLETPETRRESGKPEAGTITLEAAHSGNNVFIRVRDDGGGIDAEKIRARLVAKGILPEAAARALSDRDAVEYIWHPGFSTAEAISDISGRGVGMDIVKTRIALLNGTVEVETRPGGGTTFTVRLPLTLAIIRSLLFRVKHGIFAVPLDNVREIVSVPLDEIISVHGKKTFEVRNEFLPLLDIDDIFDWHGTVYTYRKSIRPANDGESKRVNVVLLQSANRTMGLKVDELHGGQDIVIKSLAENFLPIRGLSGASILGDGAVCLLLDVGTALEMRNAEFGVRS